MKCGGVKAVPMDVSQGENFSQEPKKQENKKHKKKWATDIVGLTQLQKLREPPPKKKNKFRPMERVWGEAGQVTWGETLCFFFVFPWVLGHFWAKVAKTSRKPNNTQQKKHRPMERVWGEAGQVTWGETFFNCFSMVLDQLFPLSEFGLFVWEFVIDPSSRNGSRSADRMILSRQYKTCALLRCARLHPPWSSLL